MLVLVALMALAQVDGGGGAEAADAGVEWALPAEIPFVPIPDDPLPVEGALDAGVVPPVAPAEAPTTTAASARVSLVMEEMPLATGSVIPYALADIRVSRRVGAWVVGVSSLFSATSAQFHLFDVGTNFFAGWQSTVDSTYGVQFAVHPLGLQRLRVGSAPVSYGGDLGPILPIPSGGMASSSTFPDPRVALSIAASLGRFEVHGWTQTMQIFELSGSSFEPRRVAQFAAGGSGRFGPLVTGVDVIHAPRGNDISMLSSGGRGPAPAPVTFRSARLHVGASSKDGVPAPVDFGWEGFNPELHLAFFPAEEPASGFNWVAKAEASRIVQQFPASGAVAGNRVVGSPLPVASEREMWVGAVIASFQTGRFRGHFRGLARPADYFVVEAPAHVFGSAVLAGGTTELLGRLTAEWLFGPSLPRVGLGAGLLAPATARVGGALVRFRNPWVFEATPSTSMLVEGRGTLSWQPHPLTGIAAELKAEVDPERTSFDPAQATRLYASLLLQVRL